MSYQNAKQLKEVLLKKTKLENDQLEIVRKNNGIQVFYVFQNRIHKESLNTSHFPSITEEMVLILSSKISIKFSSQKEKHTVIGVNLVKVK